MPQHHPASQPSARKAERGFTLVELLVVIVIIGIIAAIATPIFLGQRRKGVDASLIADLNSAAKRAEAITTDRPLSAAKFTAAEFANEGFEASPSNVVEIAGSPAGGYCVRGVNPGSSATHATTKAFWFDSKAAGMQEKPGTAPGGGACASAADWVTIG